MNRPIPSRESRTSGTSTRLRVAYVSQWYDPERGAAAVSSSIARGVARVGFDVTTLTGFPNYPDGHLYPGYSMHLHSMEQLDGIAVHRVPLLPNHKPNLPARLANYGSYALSASAAAPRVLQDSDVALVHMTPATAALPALALKLTRKVPYVLHVQDLWPDTVLSSGFLSGGALSLSESSIHRFCDLMYRHAHSIAVTSPGMKDKIISRGIPDAKVHFAPNWADETAFRPTPVDDALKRELGLRPFTVMYAGNLGQFQALDALLDVAASTLELEDVGYLILGGGSNGPHVDERIERERLTNVVRLPAQPFSAMSRFLALGDLHYIGLVDEPLFNLTIPSKLQATLAVGRPILGHLRGDAAEIITDARAGICVAPGDIEGLVAGVRKLSANPAETARMGANARSYYDRYFSETASAGILANLLISAASSRT